MIKNKKTPKETSNKLPKMLARPKIINVDQQFDGDIQAAVSAANAGDTIQLGNDIYQTPELYINKKLTIVGKEKTVINGGGTRNPIIKLESGAAGTTIRDLEITNGNIGIYSEEVANLTLENLDIHNIGIKKPIQEGQNNSGIILSHADGLKILDVDLHNIGRKGVGISDTQDAVISGLTLEDINLDAMHAQSYDAAGIKLFNTDDIVLRNNSFSEINAMHIWNDTTNDTLMEGNQFNNVGDVFKRPDFNSNVYISGIYNEKSSNSVVRNNQGTAEKNFLVLDATEFSTETMVFRNNDFSSYELNTTDYWANEPAETLVAVTEDPELADFSLFSEDYFATAIIE